jgi:hypothetical protein
MPDVSLEKPLLVDPSERLLDPLDHIVWTPVDPKAPRSQWLWTPREKTERGRATIAILRLGELADEVAAHLRALVLRGVEEIERELKGGRTAAARTRWATLLGDAFAPETSFTAAAWCALEHHWMPPQARAKHGLAPLVRPG